MKKTVHPVRDNCPQSFARHGFCNDPCSVNRFPHYTGVSCVRGNTGRIRTTSHNAHGLPPLRRHTVAQFFPHYHGLRQGGGGGMVVHGKPAGRRRRVWQAAILTASVWAGLAPEPAVATAAAAGRGEGRGKGYHKGGASDAYARGRKMMRGSEGAGRAPAGGGGREAAAVPPEARVVVGAGDGGEGRMLRWRRRTSERGDIGRSDLSGQAEQGEASLLERQGRGGHAAGIHLPPSEGSMALADDAARRRGDSSVEGRHPAPPTHLELLRAGGAAATLKVSGAPPHAGAVVADRGGSMIWAP